MFKTLRLQVTWRIVLSTQGFKRILKAFRLLFCYFKLEGRSYTLLMPYELWKQNDLTKMKMSRICCSTMFLFQNKILLWKIKECLFQHFHSFLLDLLRYGLPVNFQAMLLQPNKKTMKKLREVLYDLYKHLDSSAAAIIDVSIFVTAIPLKY